MINNTRYYPRSTREAFRYTCEHACAIERFDRQDRPVIAAGILCLVLLLLFIAWGWVQ